MQQQQQQPMCSAAVCSVLTELARVGGNLPDAVSAKQPPGLLFLTQLSACVESQLTAAVISLIELNRMDFYLC